jgi:hypothetical protein
MHEVRPPQLAASVLSRGQKCEGQHDSPSHNNQRSDCPNGYFKLLFRGVRTHSTPQLAASFRKPQGRDCLPDRGLDRLLPLYTKLKSPIPTSLLGRDRPWSYFGPRRLPRQRVHSCIRKSSETNCALPSSTVTWKRSLLRRWVNFAQSSKGWSVELARATSQTI